MATWRVCVCLVDGISFNGRPGSFKSAMNCTKFSKATSATLIMPGRRFVKTLRPSSSRKSQHMGWVYSPRFIRSFVVVPVPLAHQHGSLQLTQPNPCPPPAPSQFCVFPPLAKFYLVFSTAVDLKVVLRDFTYNLALKSTKILVHECKLPCTTAYFESNRKINFRDEATRNNGKYWSGYHREPPRTAAYGLAISPTKALHLQLFLEFKPPSLYKTICVFFYFPPISSSP